MKVIHKYIIEYKIGGDGVIEMPKGAKILKIDKHANDICLWAIVDISADHQVEKRRFVPFLTGWKIPDYENLEYINTMFDNGFALHWFEEKK